MVTILDAHPDIAMSYELYPQLLSCICGDKKSWLSNFLKIFNKSTNITMNGFLKILKSADNSKAAAKKITDKQLRRFVLVCLRGGIDNKTLVTLIRSYLNSGHGFTDTSSCLKFIERCCIEKMNRTGKSIWGMKCTNEFNEYLKLWPDAYFINVIRDGRDVLASQLNTGNFNKNPKEIANGWLTTHKRFREFAENPNVHAYEVFYEKLVSQPEEEIRKICDFLKVPFENSMLDFYQKDLTIYTNPSGHLSLNRISNPIDSSMIGRWKKDLTSQQLDEFYSVAKDTMKTFGYMGDD